MRSNNRELVSVIVPIYNVKEYLERCVNSILNQSYENLDIILVDDGSNDGSEEICDFFARKDKRVNVIHQENRGVAAARNTGLNNCKGELICFVDSDDYVHQDYILYLYSKMEDNNCDICMCYHVVTEDWDYKGSVNWDAPIHVYTREEIFDRFYTDMHGSIIMLWNKIIRKDCIGNIRFDEGFIHEDEGTTFKILYNARKIAFSNEALYYYFSRDESITGIPYDKKRLDILKAYENRLSFYKDNSEKILYDRECQYYLSEILANYYKVSKLLKDKSILNELRNKYRKVYNMADRTSWSKGRRILYFVCNWIPLLYGIIKHTLR
nr:glycosyltransferase family 2 protein [Butyrivibrio sp. NC2007]